MVSIALIALVVAVVVSTPTALEVAVVVSTSTALVLAVVVSGDDQRTCAHLN